MSTTLIDIVRHVHAELRREHRPRVRRRTDVVPGGRVRVVGRGELVALLRARGHTLAVATAAADLAEWPDELQVGREIYRVKR